MAVPPEASPNTMRPRKYPRIVLTLISLSIFVFAIQLSSVLRFQPSTIATESVSRIPRDKVPTVYILSHRRSGTHLTMDLLAHILPHPFRLVKTNHVYLTESSLPKDVEEGINCKCLNHLRRTGKMIHVYRDVRDVVTSMYYYYQTFNPSFMKNVSKAEYFDNKNGVRNKVIETWVNTTVPWFMHNDIFQLPFSDAASGFEHIYDKIALFLGHDMRKKMSVDLKKAVSKSGAVAKLTGRGDHGYKDDMSLKIADEVMRVARSMHSAKRQESNVCPPSLAPENIFHRFINSFAPFERGFWIGGDKKYGLFVPNYCPAILKGSKVVLETGAEYTDVLLEKESRFNVM